VSDFPNPTLPVYPHIFLEGPQALIVSSAFDPDVMLDEWAKRGFSPKLWTPKLTGTDTGGVAEIQHGINRARARGLKIGGWIQCGWDVLSDVASVSPWVSQLDYIEFCVEYEYKVYPDQAKELVTETERIHLPKAIISYGRLDTQIDNGAFARAGWAVCPEAYGSFNLWEADSYFPLWPGKAVHPLQRKLPPDKYRGNKCGVYRPEGLL
jgi:hypothetical protein